MKKTYLSDLHLATRFSVSRATIWRWVATEKLPKPVKLSTGCTRWKLSNIEEWEESRGE
jgi:prophage regulatory protein